MTISSETICKSGTTPWSLPYGAASVRHVSPAGGIACLTTTAGNVECVAHPDASPGGDLFEAYTQGNAKEAALGFSERCILTVQGDVSCVEPSSTPLPFSVTGSIDIDIYASTETMWTNICVLKSGGYAECFRPNEATPHLTHQNALAKGISAGLDHACLLLEKGTVDCFSDVVLAPFARDWTGPGSAD